MIINLLLQLVYKLFDLLLVFNIPKLPDEVANYMSDFLTAISNGALVLGNFVPLRYLFVLFGVILAIDVGLGIYKFVMWILKKIPMISVS